MLGTSDSLDSVELPLDFVEDRAELCAFCGVNAFDETDAAAQVELEGWVSFAVLGGGAEACAVGKDGLELVVFCPANVEVLVGDETGELLADSLAHNAGFAVVGLKALFEEDCGYMVGEAFDVLFEGFRAGECQVVRVTGVFRVG